MTVVPVAEIERRGVTTLTDAREAIQLCETVEEAMDATARVAAAKAWAKAYGKLRAYRLDLLTLEVEALIRVIQLGGADQLSHRDREAGEYLAAMTDEARAELIRQSGKMTTAHGMCQQIWREQREREHAEQRRYMGARWASGQARGRQDFSERISDVLNDQETAGRPFEIEDVAEAVADMAGDTEFMEGVREACRRAVRRSGTETLDGTTIPKFITSQLPDSTWVRIPVLNATYGDALKNLQMREAQLAQDQAALNKFRAFVSRLSTYLSDEDDPISDALTASVATP